MVGQPAEVEENWWDLGRAVAQALLHSPMMEFDDGVGKQRR